MDKQSLAHLDKTKIKVMCGSCHKRIAGVNEVRFQPILKGKGHDLIAGDGCLISRVLELSLAYEPDLSGMWRLNSRAAKRAKRNRPFAVRRQSKVLGQHGMPIIVPVDMNVMNVWKPTIVPLGEARHVELPIKVQCPYCSSIQSLLCAVLELTISETHFGTGAGYRRVASRPVTMQEWHERQADWGVPPVIEELHVDN